MEQNVLSRDGSRHVTDEKINTSTALVGALLSIVGIPILVLNSVNRSFGWLAILGITIYGITVINLFFMSLLHHAIDKPGRVNYVLKVLDYTAIFGMIAGTMTPLVLLRYNSLVGITILLITWMIAAASISVYASIKNLGKHITNTLFISLGWIPALVILTNIHALRTIELLFLISGGVVYSIGFYFYSRELPNPIPGKFGFHEIWHILVIIGALLHYIFMMLLVSG